MTDHIPDEAMHRERRIESAKRHVAVWRWYLDSANPGTVLADEVMALLVELDAILDGKWAPSRTDQ